MLSNLCGNYELPFNTHAHASISRWIDALPKYAVVILDSLSKWDPFSAGLRLARFHRLWRSTTSHVTLVKGAWRKGELRLSMSDGIVVWVSGALHKDIRATEAAAFLLQYDHWPIFPVYLLTDALSFSDPPRLLLFIAFNRWMTYAFVPIYAVLARMGVYEGKKARWAQESFYALRMFDPGRSVRLAANAERV